MGEERKSELDELLESLGPVESSGTFTLAADKALEKLARFQLPSEEIWLAKVFQAAHLAGVRNFSAEGSRLGLRIEADCPPGWTASQVEEGLLSPRPPQESSLAHLVVGLRAGVLSQEMTLFWNSRPVGSASQAFVFQESEFLRVDHPEALEEGRLRILIRRPRARNNWSKESRFLRQRVHSSVRLVLDGKVVQARILEPEPQIGLFKVAAATFPPKRGEVGPGISYQFWDLGQSRPPSDQSFVAWVKDGMIVDHRFEVQDDDFALQMFVNADHLQSDLSGWQLVPDTQNETHLRTALGFGVGFLKEHYLKAEEYLVYPRRLLKRRRRGAGLGALGIAAAGGVLASSLTPHLTLTLDATYYAWYSGQVFVQASPWLAGALGLRWNATRSQERRLVEARRRAIRKFYYRWEAAAAWIFRD